MIAGNGDVLLKPLTAESSASSERPATALASGFRRIAWAVGESPAGEAIPVRRPPLLGPELGNVAVGGTGFTAA
ncbi:hypothetical protein [Nocardia jiangsuensis]|uniref:Uncharacterized protein n=1 Tax=Nocardia jiangsuensis TaxID=1691563 RepID=A0ABV8E100_9NOCA